MATSHDITRGADHAAPSLVTAAQLLCRLTDAALDPIRQKDLDGGSLSHDERELLHGIEITADNTIQALHAGLEGLGNVLSVYASNADRTGLDAGALGSIGWMISAMGSLLDGLDVARNSVTHYLHADDCRVGRGGAHG